jgi:hypothetical protein
MSCISLSGDDSVPAEVLAVLRVECELFVHQCGAKQGSLMYYKRWAAETQQKWAEQWKAAAAAASSSSTPLLLESAESGKVAVARSAAPVANCKLRWGLTGKVAAGVRWRWQRLPPLARWCIKLAAAAGLAAGGERLVYKTDSRCGCKWCW